MLFNTTTADNNSNNGFNFEAAGGAFMTARIDSVSASNNGGYGVRLDAQDMGTSALLLPTGVNTIAGNGLGSYSVNYNNVNLAVIALTGSFDGVAGDGIHIDINNVGTAVVSLTGDGTDTIDNNTGDGVDIRIANADTVGIRIAGYNSISGNTEDGVHIVLTDVATAAAIEILGPTAMTNNGDNGVDITLFNVALGPFVAPPGLDPLSVITLDDNNVANICLPTPVDVPFSTFVTVPASDGILVDGLTISRVAAPAGQDGIAINGTNVSGSGLVALTNNSINNYDNGIDANFGGASLFGGLTIDNTVVTNSATSGIGVTTNGSGVPITITGTTVSASGGTGLNVQLTNAIGGSNVILDNVTVTNSGGAGVAILGDGNFGNVSLTNVSATNSTVGDGVSVVLANGSVDTVTLNNVSSRTSGGDGVRVDLNGLNVATAVTVNGQGTAVANDSAGDGVVVSLVNVTGTPGLSVGGYASVNNNGGRGIAVSATGTDVGVVDLSNNTVGFSNGGDGIQLVLDSNVAGPVLLSNNIVDNSFDDGISLVLDNVTGGPDVSTINSTVTNSGGFGITLTANNATLGNILLDPIVVTNSAGGDGVLVGLTNSSANSILVDRVSVDTSAARGINIDLNNVSGLQSVVVTGPASVLNSTSDGIRIGLNNVTGGPDVAVRSMIVDQSGGRGIAIESSNATTLGDVSVVNTTIRNSGAQGMLVDLGPGAVGSVLIDVNSVSDSGGRGVDVNLDGVTGAPGVTVRNTTALRSGGRGISVAGSAATLGNVVLTNVSSDTTTANEGVAVVFDTNSTTGSIGLNNVSAVRSAAGGILLDLNAVMLTGAAPTIIINGQNTAVATNNGGDGIFMNLTNVTGATAAPDLYITNYNLVDQNAGRGIALDSNGSAVGAVSVSSNSVSNSTAGQGIQIDLTGSSVGSLLVADDSIRDSSGRGVDVILDNVTGSPSVSVRNTTALRSGGRGVSVEGSGATLANVSLSNVSSDTTTADEGVAVIFDTASTTGSIGLSNVSATRSTAGGILVDLNTVTMTGVNPGVSINGLNTAQSTNNGGDGILARLNAVTGAVVAPDVNVSNYLLVDQNAGRGIGIESNGSNVDAVTVLNNIVSNSTAGQGIQVDLTGSGLRSLIVDFNTITDSSDRGLDVILDTVTGSSTIAVRNTTAARSGGRGISVEGSTATLGSVTLLNVSSTTTAADEGVAVVFDTNSTVGPIVLNNVSATLSNAGGILVDLNTVAMTGPNAGINVNGLGTAQSTINGGDGILVNLNVVTGSPDVSVSNYLLIDQNAGRGIGVLGIGSVLDDVTVSDNIVSNSTAGQGIQINLTNSTVGSLVADNNTISDSSDRGFDVILDGTIGSPDITISDLSVARSGGRGVSVAGSGSTLGNATLSNVLSNTTTTGEGVAVVLDNGTVGSVLLNNVSANLSAAGGILVDLNTMNVGPSVIVDGLGTAVVTDNVGDGIFVNLTGVTGTPNVGIDNQGFVDNNAGRGIALDTNGSAVGAVSLSNNFIDRSTAGQGMLVDLTGSNVGSLLVDSNTIANSFGRGLDVLLDNVTGTPAISISNTTVTASGGRGVSVEGTGATLGDVSLTNVSSETTTTEEGVAIILDNGTVGSILLNNVSATASFAGGILVDLNTMNVGGDIVVDAQGVAVSDDNGGDGIFVNLVGVNGTPNVNIDGYISVDNNAGRGIALFSDGPTLGDVSISRNVVSNSTGGDGVQVVMTNAALASLTVDGNQVTISRDNGINIDLTASSIVADNGSILNNTINTSLNGDGLRLAFSTVTADGFLIDFNNSQSNSDNGFNLDFTNSPIDRLTITNNSGGVAVNTALTFFITGDTNTQPFAITNSSDPGVLLQSFSLNLLTAVPQPLLFDTVTPAGAVAFQPTAPTDVTTGLTTVNGTAITQGTNPLQDSMGVVLVGGGVPDDSSQFTLGFNDFDPSETFNWSIDVDPFGGTAGVFGNELIGSTVNVTFSGGLSLGGTLMAVAGDPLASTFVATSGNVAGNGIANNGLDGVRFSLNNSSLTNMLMDNNQIEFNGTSGTGHGVNFATVNNSDITLANISNNEIDGNAGDGFRLINPDTAGAVIGLTFEDNEITTNTGTGIELQIDNAEIANIAINSVATGNQISSNGIAGATNGFGVHLSAIDTAQYTLNVGGAGPIVNTFDGNRNAGIAVEATDMTVGAITLSNTTLSGTLAGGNVSFAGDGFSLRTAQQAQVTALTIGDAAVRNTLFDENVGDGITVNAIENSQFTNGLLIQNISSTGNNSDGISITRRDDALFSNDVNANNIIENGEAHVVLNNVIATGNSANGLNVLVTNAQLPITRIDIADTTNDAVADSRFDSNGTGMRFTGSADAVLVVNASDTSASNNDNGVIITLSNNSTIGDMIPGLGNVNNPASIASTFNGMTISNNANVGFGVTTNDATLANITMTNSALTGARNFLNGNRGNSIQLTANSSSAANFDFDAVNITNTAGAVTGDGLNVVANASSNVTLRLTDAFIGNVIPTTVLPGMTGDGIDITSTSNSNVTFNLGDDLATGVVDVGIYGNGGNGIVIRNNESSTFTGNLNNVASRFNDGRGYSAQMSAAATGNGNYIHNIDDSSFGENGREGIAFITNAGTHNQDQSGPLLFGNTGFPGDNRPFPIGDGNDFLNLNTDLDAQLTLTNSLVQNNGTVANSNGLVIAVSTNSTVQADVRGNTFSGNTLDDLATSSFITTNGGFDANGNATGAAIQTNASVNTNGVGTFDSVFQDDTAQLDLRFLRNTGDQVNVTSLGAIYAADAAKAGGNRRADIFQVNAFHTSTMQAGSTTTSIISAPADVVALDASVTDPAGIVNVANFYQNVNPNRFTSVRLENVTNPGATGLIAANTNTGTFDLTGNAVGNANAGDVFRVFLLDTNVFNQSGAPQDVHAAFTNNFFTQFGADSNGPGGGNPFPGATTPTATYFNFPDAVFP